ncbi:M15 family metallopeptidase [Sphingomonas sp. Leaf37]|uniref:M15 family metallopeptidase n=1 Tax=Sphingomonas sp. Leaf37 TaxID=2876552 RepID=UPI001E607E90|nr:M15 family metallopeptidase [Sphingomonas sp. Leaf37]
MAGRQTRELYLSITGNADGVSAASKAGRTALLSLSSAAIDVKAEVEKAFADMGASAPAQAKQLERSYTKTFEAIRANSKAVLDQPSQGGALTVLNAGAAEQAATAAEHQAAALRQMAAAAATVAQRAGEAGAEERILAVASEANAQQAEREAVALRNQANVLGMVRNELQANGIVQRVVTGRNEQQRQSTIMLGQQLQDFSVQVVSGQSVVTAFSQQIGQAAFAVQGMGGKMEAVAGFLTSGWGIAATVGVTVLLPLIAKVIEHGDALKEETDQLKSNAEKAAIADQAKDAFRKTEAGAIDDVRQLTEELKKQNDALKTNAELTNIRAKEDVEQLRKDRAKLAKQLSDARGAQRVADGGSYGGVAGGGSVVQGEAAKRVAKLTKELGAVDAKIAEGTKALDRSRAELADEAAKRSIDPVAQINRRYDAADGLIEQAKKRAIAEGTVDAVLTKQLATLRAQQKAEVEAAQKKISAANRTPNNNQIGREVTIAEASAIAASIGGRVTSGLRSTEKQQQIWDEKMAGRHAGPVARPGTSDHERGKAIDIAYGPGISESSIREAFAKQGVKIRQLLNEPAQRVFHVGFGEKGKSQESIARSEEAAEQKRARDAEAYTQLLGGAQEEQLRLERNRTLDISAAADLDAAAVTLERERLDSAVQAGVAQKRWTQGQADAVKLVNAANAAMKTEAVRKAQGMALLDQQLDADRDALGRSSAMLQLQGDLATTNAGRRAIALRLLANDEAEQRARAVKLIGSDNPADWARGESMLQDIDAQHPLRTAQVERQNATPMERYRQQLKETADDMDTALQGVTVNAFQELESGLLGLIDGTESVGSAFKKMASSIIADLARIAIQRAIISAIPGAGSFFGLKLAEGGKVEGKATGGRISGPGTGTSDSIFAMIDGTKPLMVSNGESIVTAEATARWWPIIDAMNKGTLQVPGLATGGLVEPSRIFMRSLPAPDSMRAPGSDHVSIPISIDARGADPAGLARLEAALDQLRRDLPAQAVQAIVDAKQRRVIA